MAKKQAKNKDEVKEEKQEEQKAVEVEAVETKEEKKEEKTEKKVAKKAKKPSPKKEKEEKSSDKKPKKAKKEEKTGKKPQSMEELFSMTGYEPVVPRKGDKVEGVITLKNNKMLKVDLGAKTEGVVADNEFDFAQDFIEELEEGDTVKATVLSVENEQGQIQLSLKGAASDAKWEYFEAALDDEKVLHALGIEANKGGLIIEINGVRGFVPSSQFGRCYLGNIEQLKGKKFDVRAIEVDREKNRLIFSERHVSEAKQMAQKEHALDVVKEGGVYEGIISGVRSFGLFMTVEVPLPVKDDEAEDAKKADAKEGDEKEEKKKKAPIGYVEGLIHISEISWEKVNHPRDYHQVGDRVEVKVLGVDENSGKLNLSIKRLSKDPWQQVAEEYPAGTTFTGKVTRIEPFGAFVDVMPGVDGLIHVSKLNPSVRLAVGDEVTVNVDSVEPKKRRMSLSMVVTEVPMGYK